jgi:hypothetical protein
VTSFEAAEMFVSNPQSAAHTAVTGNIFMWLTFFERHELLVNAFLYRNIFVLMDNHACMLLFEIELKMVSY